MATRDIDKDELLEKGIEALATEEDATEAELAERKKIFAQMAKQVEHQGLQENILQKYQSSGRTMLADALPSKVDPMMARALRGILGKDVSDVRVHTGRTATEAARAMDARAFAIGDKDIFFDATDFNPHTNEGKTLLAHEIAHTTDASTGFAMSSRGGNSTSAREQFAHEVENKFARELEDPGDDVARSEMEPAAATKPGGQPKEPDVDKVLLAQKIAEVLEKQDEQYALRHGHWARP